MESLHELITDVASAQANSYATLEEFDQYIASRDGFDIESWNSLTENQKIERAIYGESIIDSLKFRGKKAVKYQALAFPRIMPDDKLYNFAEKMYTWEDLCDFVNLMQDLVLPEIPECIKFAQIEASYQIVHSHLMKLEPMEDAEQSIASLGIDVIHMSFNTTKSNTAAFSLFSKEDFSATSSIKLLLQKYLGSMRGELV